MVGLNCRAPRRGPGSAGSAARPADRRAAPAGDHPGGGASPRRGRIPARPCPDWGRLVSPRPVCRSEGGNRTLSCTPPSRSCLERSSPSRRKPSNAGAAANAGRAQAREPPAGRWGRRSSGSSPTCADSAWTTRASRNRTSLRRALRLQSVTLAYDDTLCACCTALEIEAPGRPPFDLVQRLEIEATLAQCGLTW